MGPLIIPGIALVGGILVSKKGGASLFKKSKRHMMPRPQPKPRPRRSARKAHTSSNPIHTLFRRLSASISGINKRPVTESYSDIVRRFIPGDAKLIVPPYPLNSKEFLFVDLDGDSQNELVSSFRYNDELRTIVLKKQNGNWNVIGDIDTSGYENINYRNAVDLTGNGKKQLVLGLNSNKNTQELHGYSLEGDSLNKVFSNNYDRFELLNPGPNRSTGTKSQLAIWNKEDSGSYDIKVLKWNEGQLEPTEDIRYYYRNNVAPLYAKRVKQMPYSPSNWYNLANALAKAGLHRDASAAIDIGMSVDRNSEYTEKFISLRNSIG